MNREELAIRLFATWRAHAGSGWETWANVTEQVRCFYRALADEAIRCLTPNAG